MTADLSNVAFLPEDGPAHFFDVNTVILPNPAARQFGSLPRDPPVILMNPDPEWRAECLRQVGHIPSGYTYLAQLMGHDMGSSVSLDSVPHLERATLKPAQGLTVATNSRRYNLIEHPLTLETIYGAGPTMLLHLYDPKTMLFRLHPRALLAQLHRTANGDVIRALYDERNRDTLMLHELTIAFMQYHNFSARKLLAAGSKPFIAYAGARAHVVGVWHEIVRNDLLPRFLHPAIANGALHAEWQLDETTLLIGLFRCFHALPLAGYKFAFSGPHNLNRLMKNGYQPSSAERDWRVGWDQFLGAVPGGPLTGISLSVAEELRLPTGSIAQMDFGSSGQAGPLRLGHAAIKATISLLPPEWHEQLTPEHLASDFHTKHPQAPVHPTAFSLEQGPLYQTLMLEAQCHGEKGGFGPLGSALLLASIQGAIDRIALADEPAALEAVQKPATMLELIKLVRSELE